MSRIRLSLVAAAIVCGLLFAACLPGPTLAPSSSAQSAADWRRRGPITLLSPRDLTGTLAADIAEWNLAHPNEPVTHLALADDPGQAHSQVLQQVGSSAPNAAAVVSVPAAWIPELVAGGRIAALPAESVPTEDLVKGATQAATVGGRLYALPGSVDVSVLYYRADLLAAAGVASPPKTWDDLAAACALVAAQPGSASLGCYGGQFQAGEDLTANAVEVIRAAGGDLVSDGSAIASPDKVAAGLSRLATGFRTGLLPGSAKGWAVKESRTAFAEGELVFLRDWSVDYVTLTASDATLVTGRLGVAPLPGLTGLATPTLRGENLAISAATANKGTAAAFITWLNTAERQSNRARGTGSAPSRESVLRDAALVRANPAQAVVVESVNRARPLPTLTRYSEASQAIQAAARAVIDGRDAGGAVAQLQSTLETLLRG